MGKKVTARSACGRGGHVRHGYRPGMRRGPEAVHPHGGGLRAQVPALGLGGGLAARSPARSAGSAPRPPSARAPTATAAPPGLWHRRQTRPRTCSMCHHSRARAAWNRYALRGHGPEPLAPLPKTTDRPHWPCSRSTSLMQTPHNSAARTPDREAIIVVITAPPQHSPRTVFHVVCQLGAAARSVRCWYIGGAHVGNYCPHRGFSVTATTPDRFVCDTGRFAGRTGASAKVMTGSALPLSTLPGCVVPCVPPSRPCATPCLRRYRISVW